jgi:ABC-type phosphate/phosphonate transport system substrate-binding protein
VDPGIGRTIAGRYELLREIGRGATSVVYEARNVLTERTIALKVLDLEAGARVRQHFMTEARTAARLTHPNIVRVDEVGDAGATLYLVEELLDGPSLADVIASRGMLSLEQALELLLPIADALAHAHDHGIVHRDVKPSNIVIARMEDGSTVPKLVDFGIAKESESATDAGPRRDGAILGTPQYMAPEQITDGARVDARADQWALAMCLHEALTGDVPIRGSSVHALFAEVLRFDPAAEGFLAATPAPVRDVLRTALHADPEHRFPSMRDLAAALEHALREAHARADRATAPPPPSAELDIHHAPVPEHDLVAVDAPLRMGLVVTARDVDPVRVQDALREVLGARASVLRMASYAELGVALEEGDIELAWLPPAAFARGIHEGTAQGLAALERDGRTEYASAILARTEVIRSWADLRGCRAAWVDPWSAAGYLVPIAMLRAHGIDESDLASHSFLGSYDAVMDALVAGTADVGPAHCAREETLMLVGEPADDEVPMIVLEVSDPIPSDLIAISTREDPSIAARIRAILLDREASAPLCRAMGASSLIEVDVARYQRLI